MYRPPLKRRCMGRAPSQTSGAVMIDRVRETIARYLSGAIDADDLAAQMPDPWEIDRAGGDEAVRRLVMRVIGYVTEFQNGDSSEPRLRDRLRRPQPLP